MSPGMGIYELALCFGGVVVLLGSTAAVTVALVVRKRRSR